MKHTLAITLTLTLLAVAAPQGASAACYADYKAKQDNPLKLHYGVAELTGACANKEAKAELKAATDRKKALEKQILERLFHQMSILTEKLFEQLQLL